MMTSFGILWYPLEGYSPPLTISNGADSFKVVIAHNARYRWFGVRFIHNGKDTGQSAVMDYDEAKDLITFLEYFMSGGDDGDS